MQTQGHHNDQCKNKEIRKTVVKEIVFNASGEKFIKQNKNISWL